MFIFQISDTAIMFLVLVTLYVLFCITDWAVEKTMCLWRKRKENHE